MKKLMASIEEVRVELAKQIERDYNNVEYADGIIRLENRGIVFAAVDEVREDMNQFGMSLESAVEKTLDEVIDNYM